MRRDYAMTEVTLSAAPKGNGYQATVRFPDGVSLSSSETYPSISEAIAAAAMHLLGMQDRIDALDAANEEGSGSFQADP